MSKNLQNLLDKKSKIRNGEPFTECGLTFYPILMCDYEKFIACRDALTLRQSTFPARYMSKSYLSALWAMEWDSITTKKESSGVLFRVLNLLFMSLRIDVSSEKVARSIHYNPQNGDLSHIEVTQNGNTIQITPIMFSAQIRPLIAELNGLKLPDETLSPQLVKDAEDKRKMGNLTNLDFDIDEMISSVAYQTGVREKELNEWTVREFEARRRAITRDKNHTKYGQAEMSGMVTFKNGNPFPSWELDLRDDSLGMVKLSETGVGSFLGGANGAKQP